MPSNNNKPPKNGWKFTAIIFITLSTIFISLSVFLVSGKLNKQESWLELGPSTNEDDENSATDNTDRYLTIKEWSIKLRIPEGLNNVVYSIDKDGADIDQLSVTTSEFDRCKEGLGTLLRSADADAIKYGNDIISPNYELNNKYYWYKFPSAPCTDN